MLLVKLGVSVVCWVSATVQIHPPYPQTMTRFKKEPSIINNFGDSLSTSLSPPLPEVILTQSCAMFIPAGGCCL